MISRYKVLPELVGRALLPVGFLARLPSSMTQIGLVVLVTTTYHSVGDAGLAAAFLAAGTAVGGPYIGSLSDRLGQRSVILVASLLNSATTLALAFLVMAQVPLALVCAAALAAGATAPQIGPLLRARWIHLTEGGPALSPALSYEGAADEVAYVLGPAGVSLVAAIFSPAAAVIASALLVGVFGSMVALHRTALVVPATHGVHIERGPALLAQPRLLALVLSGLAIGVFFGGMQTGVTGTATEVGLADAAGAIYAVMGIGSAIAGLATAALPERFALGHRLWIFGVALTLLAIPMMFANTVPALIVLLIPLGCAVGPYLITVYAMAEKQVPPGRTAALMTLISAGLVVGYSIGSSIGGQLVDRVDPSAAFAVSVVAMALGVGLALALRATESRAAAEPSVVRV